MFRSRVGPQLLILLMLATRPSVSTAQGPVQSTAPKERFELAIVANAQGGGCHKEPIPKTSTIFHENDVIEWHFKNTCGKRVMLHFHDVKLKHKFLVDGPNPFAGGTPADQSIDDNGEATFRVTIRTKASIGDDDVAGFNVYKYAIKITPGGDDDPEIIIEWPL